MAVCASSLSFQVFFRSKASQVPALLVRCHYVLHLFTWSLIGSLISRGGEDFCFDCLCFNYMGLLCVFRSCDHFVSLQSDSKTRHCANTKDPLFCYYSELKKKCLTGRFSKETLHSTCDGIFSQIACIS